MSVELAKSIKVFYSYAQKDEVLRDELEKHLGALKRLQLIEGWHKRDIQVGTDWKETANVHLDTADIILLLISADFMGSDYCYSVEMQRALERHQQGKTRVIPIILRPVDLEGTPIASLRTLPSNGKPITKWSNRDEAFKDVSQDIRRVLQDLKTSTAGNSQLLGEIFKVKINIDEPIKDLASTTNKMTIKAHHNSFQTQQTSYYKTIDTHEAVALFHKLIQPDSDMCVLRLVGEAKMGKSHLLTKVFPSMLQQDDHACYAVLDMRNRMDAVPDILHMACSLINPGNFDCYNAAYREWSQRLKTRAHKSQTNDLYNPATEREVPEDIQARDRELTAQFVRDLAKFDDRLLLFLFDSVSNATPYMQMWLANTFLAYVSRSVHVRTIIAGRSLPDVHGSYALNCESYQLQAVTDVEDFISYCQGLNARLGEQSIRDFAYACDYVPGMFAELVYPKFIK